MRKNAVELFPTSPNTQSRVPRASICAVELFCHLWHFSQHADPALIFFLISSPFQTPSTTLACPPPQSWSDPLSCVLRPMDSSTRSSSSIWNVRQVCKAFAARRHLSRAGGRLQCQSERQFYPHYVPAPSHRPCRRSSCHSSEIWFVVLRRWTRVPVALRRDIELDRAHELARELRPPYSPWSRRSAAWSFVRWMGAVSRQRAVYRSAVFSQMIVAPRGAMSCGAGDRWEHLKWDKVSQICSGCSIFRLSRTHPHQVISGQRWCWRWRQFVCSSYDVSRMQSTNLSCLSCKRQWRCHFSSDTLLCWFRECQDQQCQCLWTQSASCTAAAGVEVRQIRDLILISLWDFWAMELSQIAIFKLFLKGLFFGNEEKSFHENWWVGADASEGKARGWEISTFCLPTEWRCERMARGNVVVVWWWKTEEN